MKKQQHGFTIVELLIATTVFSVVMIICLAAFLRVGQLYYKGIYLSHTQEAGRDISDDIVNQLRLNGSHTTLAKSTVQLNGHDVYYICIGNKRYSFMSGYVVGSTAEDNGHFGLVRDDYAPPATCDSPATTTFSNPTELLNDKMRMVATGTGLGQSDLNNICPPPVGGRTICDVHVHIDFGDDDLLTDPTAPGTACYGPLSGSQFCATSDIDTTVYPLQ